MSDEYWRHRNYKDIIRVVPSLKLFGKYRRKHQTIFCLLCGHSAPHVENYRLNVTFPNNTLRWFLRLFDEKVVLK